MKLYLGADHQGSPLRDAVFAYLVKRGYEVEQVGPAVFDPDDDFPIFAQAAALQVIAEENSRAILVCGGGQGMAMAANRFAGIRAGVAWDAYEAKMLRNDLDCNVLCLPARLYAAPDASAAWEGVLETWINTPFSHAVRFQRRNKEMDELS